MIKGRWSAFGLFSETLLTGVVVAVLSVPVLTLIPALAAGTAHLHRYTAARTSTIRMLLTDFAAAWRELWPIAFGAVMLVGMLVVNAALLAAGAVPGGVPLAVLMSGLAITAGIVCLRVAGRWWLARLPARDALRAAAQASISDVGGSALVALAVGMCVVLAWMLVPLAVLAPGLLALALLVVEQRADRSGAQWNAAGSDSNS
jgi:hypothetical protein